MRLGTGDSVELFTREERVAQEAENVRLKSLDPDFVSLREAVVLTPPERRRNEARIRASVGRWPEGWAAASLAFLGVWDPTERMERTR